MRNIHQLPLVHTRTRDQICNPCMCLTENGTHDLLVYRTMLQSNHTNQDGVSLKGTCSKPGINTWPCLSHSYRYQDVKEKIRVLISMPFSHICKYFTTYFWILSSTELGFVLDSGETFIGERQRTGNKQCHPSVSFHDSKGIDGNESHLDTAAIKECKQGI